MEQKLEKSRYGSAIATAAREMTDSLVLVGDFLIVERVKLPEAKTASGIVISTGRAQVNTMSQNPPHFARVLARGAGVVDDAGNDVDSFVDVGNVIMVGKFSVNYFSTLPVIGYESESVGVCRESEVQMKFVDDPTFEKFFRAFEGAGL